MGGSRGRLINTSERQTAIELISNARNDGARKRKACEILGLSLRTVERWEQENGLQDKRRTVERIPKNKLTKELRAMIIDTANNAIYRDLPPCKIVPLLADEGKYIASESTFYRVLREENQLTHRQGETSSSSYLRGLWPQSGMDMGHPLFTNPNCRSIFLFVHDC